MRKVNQKTISPIDGDCLGACIASILELDEYPVATTNWLDFWNEFLEPRNMQIIEYPFGSFPVPIGYAILVVRSAVFPGSRHAVVFHGDGYDGKIVHNPNPVDKRGVKIDRADWLSFKVFALIDASKTKKE